MSKTNKSKSSLTNVIKERAKSPDFLPKSFIEDSTRLAEETHPRAREPLAPRSPEPPLPDPRAQKTKAFAPVQSHEYTHPGFREPASSRSYAHVVLSTEGPQEEFMLPTRGYALTPTSGTESPYRRKMTRTATYLAAQAKDQLRALSFNERTSEEDLLREAIDMLFKQRGLPTIAFLGAPSRQQRPH